MSLTQINSGEVRVYRWDAEDGTPPVDLLSVTSIRSLCGEGHALVNWKMANLADAALGTMKRTVVGPRGGVKEVRQVFEFPSEFSTMYAASEGRQDRIDDARRWLRERAEDPRNIAAVRGTLTHEAIEKNVQWDRIERPYVESAFAGLSMKDRRKVKGVVSDEDIYFIRNGVRQYWAMRAESPMVVLAREIRVVNLTAGYAGTFDALVWMLGDFEEQDGQTVFVPLSDEKQAAARALRWQTVTAQDITRIGGTIVLLDWKTSKDVHSDQVLQAHAYLAAEFAVIDEKVDQRITALLNAAHYGGLAHIRPSGWALYMFPYEDAAIRAFLGSVAMARFLAVHEKPYDIFTVTMKGESNETEEVDAE